MNARTAKLINKVAALGWERPKDLRRAWRSVRHMRKPAHRAALRRELARLLGLSDARRRTPAEAVRAASGGAFGGLAR